MLELNKIYNTDCLEGMKQIDKNSIDLILTDPPYNISSETKIIREGGKFGKAKTIDMDFGEWDKNNIFPQDYLNLFVSLLKPNGVLIMFYDKLYLGLIGIYLQNNHNFKVRHLGNWIKSNPAPQARKVKWMNGSEQFIIATKNEGSGHHYNYELGQSPDYFKTSVSFKHLHPTQKPEELIEWLVKYWSFKNDIVLDPFMGSGTTGVVCKKLNRKFIGFEIDKNYYDIAKKRIGDIPEQLEDFF
jgi:site-specific DNA-methyltransferase (adenine-specific)